MINVCFKQQPMKQLHGKIIAITKDKGLAEQCDSTYRFQKINMSLFI